MGRKLRFRAGALAALGALGWVGANAQSIDFDREKARLTENRAFGIGHSGRSDLTLASDPSGVWDVTFTDQCLSFSSYRNRGELLLGDPFRCSDILFTETQSDDQITIDYDPASQTLKLDGGVTGDTAMIELEEAGDQSALLGTSGLNFQNETVSPDCEQHLVVGEVVILPANGDQFLYGRTESVTFEESVPGGCGTYLASRATEIRDDTAPPLWIAADQTGGLDIGNLQNLDFFAGIFEYDAVRVVPSG